MFQWNIYAWRNRMRPIFYGTVAIAMVLAIASHASQILRKSIQEVARLSDVIIIAKVGDIRNLGIQDSAHQFDLWQAECAVREVVCGHESNNVVKVTFFAKPLAPLTSMAGADRLERGKTCILFLRRDPSGLSLASPWDCRLELSASYDVFDEDQKNDARMGRSFSSTGTAQAATLTHEVLIEKARAAWQKKQAESEPGAPRNGSQPIRPETNRTPSAAGSRR
jgi:hypothetical protein